MCFKKKPKPNENLEAIVKVVGELNVPITNLHQEHHIISNQLSNIQTDVKVLLERLPIKLENKPIETLSIPIEYTEEPIEETTPIVQEPLQTDPIEIDLKKKG